MMVQSGKPAGGKQMPHLDCDPHCYPLVPTTSIGTGSNVEIHSQYFNSSSPPPFPFEIAGETWDNFVAEGEKEFIEEEKIRADNANL